MQFGVNKYKKLNPVALKGKRTHGKAERTGDINQKGNCKICGEHLGKCSSIYFCAKCLNGFSYLESIDLRFYKPTSERGRRIKEFLLDIKEED